MKSLAVYVFAGLAPIFLVAIHMFVFSILWEKAQVDKEECECSCWDTIFKGDYEDGADVTYKHVYFNCNSNTLKMWIATVFFILFMYESLKYFFRLLLLKQVRRNFAVLIICSIHSQYYSWWSYWNFWNDDYYPMWYHQLFFTITEAIVYAIVLASLDSSVEIQPWRLLIVFTIAMFHIVASGIDQFISNVVMGEGDLIMVLRDFLFMINDLVYVAVSLYELRQLASNGGTSLRQFLLHRPNLIFICLLLSVMLIYVVLFPSY